jgi:hypothetical protein
LNEFAPKAWVFFPEPGLMWFGWRLREAGLEDLERPFAEAEFTTTRTGTFGPETNFWSLGT